MRHFAICALAFIACKRDKLREPIGTRIEPPGGVRLGMSAADAKAAMPELGEGFGGAGSAGGDSPGAFLASDAQLIANMKDGRIRQLIVAFDPDHVPSEKLEAMLVDRWGVPDAPRGVLEWKSTETGWRARLSNDATLPRVEFTPYRPLTQAFFGTKVAPVGTLAKLRFGMTYAEAKAAVPELPAQSAIVTFDGGADDVIASVFFDSEKGITAMLLETASVTETTKWLTAAWKQGTPTEHGVAWSDSRWRAELTHVIAHGAAPGSGDPGSLQFTPVH